MDTRKIVERLYPETLGPRRRYLEGPRKIAHKHGSGLGRLLAWFVHQFRLRMRRLRRWAKQNAWKLVVAAVVTMFWAVAHMRFYNKVIMLEYDIQMAWAQAEAEQERRFHIQQNIVRQIVAYSQHERSLMLDLTELRAQQVRRTPSLVPEAKSEGGQSAGVAAPPLSSDAPKSKEPLPISRYAEGTQPRSTAAKPTPPASPALTAPKPQPRASRSPGVELMQLGSKELNGVFPELMMVAEQYPSLRLAENFQQFADSVVATETRITERIEQYNMAVNTYTTIITQFPGKFLSRVWGFDMYKFYEPTRDKVEFRVQSFNPPAAVSSLATGSSEGQ